MLAKNRLNLIGNPGNIWLDSYLLIILASSVLGYLTVRSLTNITLFLLLIPALIQLQAACSNARKIGVISLMKPMAITLALPVLAILVSQMLRNDWVEKTFDGPSRMLLSIPLLVYFVYKRVDFARLLSLTAPLALLMIVPLVHMYPEVLERWGGRFATTFVDPDTFGVYTLTLTAFCLFSMGTSTSRNLKLRALQSAGLLAGIYLNAGSGTRGSWLAAPFLLLLWVMLRGKNVNKLALLIGLVMLVLGFALTNYLIPTKLDRLYSGYYEVSSWLDGTNPNTSAGQRLTMWQMTWEFFKHSPIYGYGDLGVRAYLDEAWITSIASPAAREQILINGPHNEFLSNVLRSGILGGLSVLSLFFVPLSFFWRNRNQIESAQASQLGLAFIVGLMFCSLSLEVFSLKYTASFGGLILAGLAAQVIWAQEKRCY